MIPVANLLGFAGQEFARKMPKVSAALIETTFGSIVEIVILIIKHRSGSGDGAAEHGNLIPIKTPEKGLTQMALQPRIVLHMCKSRGVSKAATG